MQMKYNWLSQHQNMHRIDFLLDPNQNRNGKPDWWAKPNLNEPLFNMFIIRLYPEIVLSLNQNAGETNLKPNLHKKQQDKSFFPQNFNS